MKSSFIYFTLSFVILFLNSCQEDVKKPQSRKTLNQDTINERLIHANINLLKTENEEISNYIKRYQWEMQSTASGLRYMIYQHGKGIQAKLNCRIKINYKSSLLNGISLYSSAEDGVKSFVTGKAEVENGLEEGILLLKVGDKAKFILPSHLAFGLVGDQRKIPRKAALVYDVEVLDVKEIIK
jgi:FKBP-type peptidyl-prolyl cis-trans isomerase FkpA